MTLLGLRGAARAFLGEGSERKRGTEKTGQTLLLHGSAKASLSPSLNTLLPRLGPPISSLNISGSPFPLNISGLHFPQIREVDLIISNTEVVLSPPQEGTQQKKHKPIAGNFQQGYEFHQMPIAEA